MKNICKTSIAAAMTFLALGAHAQALYGELATAGLDYKESGLSGLGFEPGYNPTALRAILGTEISPNLAVEAMVALSSRSGSDEVNGVNVRLKVKNLWGVYAKPKVQFGDLTVFGRAGIGGASVSASANGNTVSGSGASFSGGAGVNYAITKSVSVNADYMRYYKSKGTSIEGISVGLGYQF
jgi:opacity protein-like surface antigen